MSAIFKFFPLRYSATVGAVAGVVKSISDEVDRNQNAKSNDQVHTINKEEFLKHTAKWMAIGTGIGLTWPLTLPAFGVYKFNQDYFDNAIKDCKDKFNSK